MGEATFPIILALMQWRDEWVTADVGAPMIVEDRTSGAALGVAVVSLEQVGKSVSSDGVRLTAGPGARRGTRERMEQVEARRNGERQTRKA